VNVWFSRVLVHNSAAFPSICGASLIDVNAEQMVNGGWIEYRFISGSKKFGSTGIGIDSVLDPRSVCSLNTIIIMLTPYHSLESNYHG